MRIVLLCRERKILTALLSLIFLSFASSLGAQAPTRIRIATLAPKGTSIHQALQVMGEKWKQASGGSVELTIFTDGTMGGEADTVRRIRVGQLQAGLLTTIGLSEIEPAATALTNMPMMFRSLDEVDYVREKLTPDLNKRFLSKGLIVLFWGDVGWVRFFSKEPVIHPVDLMKMKIFTWAGDNNQLEIMKSAGYHPVPLEVGDILTGLQTGLINVVPAVPFVGLAGQFYGPAPHMLELNWAPLVGGVVISKKTWDALPATMQTSFQKIANETGAVLLQKAREESVKSIDAMVKRGLIVHKTTPEIDAEWRKVAEDAYPKIRGNMVPADMFDQVQNLLKEYRSKPGTKHD